MVFSSTLAHGTKEKPSTRIRAETGVGGGGRGANERVVVVGRAIR